jgi:hypothetical protein
VHGRIIDRVKQIYYPDIFSTPMRLINLENLDGNEPGAQFRVSLSRFSKICKFVNSQLTCDDLSDVFWRSLVCNTKDVFERAIIELHANPESILKTCALMAILIEHHGGNPPKPRLKRF